MARIRTIKPEFWTDKKVLGLKPFTRLFFIGLWNFADDCGHIEDEGFQLKLQILPNDVVDAETLIEELVSVGLIKRLAGCLWITNFKKHQRIDHPSTCRFSEPSTKPHRGRAKAHESSKRPRSGREGKGREGSGKEKPSSPAKQDDVQGFEDFWNLYPRRNGKRLGKAKAERIWRGLKPQEKTAAISAAAVYAVACDSEITIAADAFRWLRDRAFNDWQEPATPSNGTKIDPTSRAGTTAYLPYKPTEPEPDCEHSSPICDVCRLANMKRLSDLMAGIT